MVRGMRLELVRGEAVRTGEGRRLELVRQERVRAGERGGG